MAEQVKSLIREGDINGLKGILSSHQNPLQLCTEITDNTGCSLHCACANGKVEIMEYLINAIECPVDIRQDGHFDSSLGVEDGDKTPLIIACLTGCREMVLFLLGKKCHLNIQDSKGQTALHYSCLANNLQMVQLLLDSKCDQSSLLSSTVVDHQHRCDVDIVDNDGRSALHISVQQGSEGIALLLLEHGAEYDLQDCKGRTALHYAVESGCKGVVEKLLDLDCAFDIVDNDGVTALHLANEGTIYDMLVKHQQEKEQKKVEIQLKNNPKDFVKQRILCSNGHQLVTRTFSPGPPTPEAELLKARSKMFKNVQNK